MSYAPPPSLRLLLRPLAEVHGLFVAARNRAFDSGRRPVTRLPVPVVSVGNLTAGGTGKTPLVAWLVARARAAGRRPGVLARGYRRVRGAALNDEGELLACRFPGLPQVQDPDRVAGGRRLVAEHDLDLIVLDDGFQHRRLHRDRDLVCVDARDPFGGGALLPAGGLREPPASLARASLVVVTRAEGTTAGERTGIVVRLRGAAGRAELPVAFAGHRAAAIVERPGGAELPVSALRGARVQLAAAIGRPAAFAATVAALGAESIGRMRVRRDHAAFATGELEGLAAAAAAVGGHLLITEKDDARLGDAPVRRWVLRIEHEFLGTPPDDAALLP